MSSPIRSVAWLLTLLLIAGCNGDGGVADEPTGSAAAATTTTAEATTTTDATTTTTTDATTTTTTDATTTTTASTAAEPAILGAGSGSGDAIVDVFIKDEVAAITFMHDGIGPFTVREYGEGDEQTAVLVDTVGPYTGTRPLQWSEPTVGFEITADGNWSYVIHPMWNSRHEACPFEGEGDDVVIVEQYKNGGSPADIAFDGGTDFTVWVYGFAAPELIVNETGPYDGTVQVADKMITWEITANGGAWTIDCG